MTINNPQIANAIVGGTGVLLKCLTFPIGIWNMVATTAKAVTIPVSFPGKYVVGVSAQIFQDAGTDSRFPLNCVVGAVAPIVQGGCEVISATTVTLWRTTGGFFDNILFDDAVQNRGYINLFYIEP